MPTFKYKNLMKSDVDVNGNAEFHFEIWQDGELLANNGSITCSPDDFSAKFTEKCNGIVDQQSVIDAIPDTGEVSL